MIKGGSNRLVLVNYAHNGYFKSQQKCSQSALIKGEVDRVICMGFNDLSAEFRTKNHDILSAVRGAGWWCWKPEVILSALEQIEPEDILIYIDCGWVFKRSVKWVLSYLEKNQFVFAEAIPRIENMTYGRRTILSDCKRFCLDYYGIEPDSREAKYHLISGGFIAMRNTPHVKSFMKNWMDDMVHDVLMIDDRNGIPKPEYEGYMRHMNDMASLNALLAVRDDCFVIGNDRKLEFLTRIWPREINYESENPKRRI